MLLQIMKHLKQQFLDIVDERKTWRINKTEYRRRCAEGGNWHNPVDTPLFYCIITIWCI